MKKLFLILFLAGCSSVIPAVDNTCAGACQHLRKLGCDEGKDLPDGTTCEIFCENTQTSGHALRPACIISLCSCDPLEMDKCQTPWMQ